MKLSEAQKEALRAIDGGADVYDYGIAVALREVEKTNPDYLKTTRARMAPKDGAKRQPYFGAILMAKGRRALKEEAGKFPTCATPLTAEGFCPGCEVFVEVTP